MPDTIRAKFVVWHVTDQNANDGTNYGQTVVMAPVYSADPQSENHAFWKATPNGQLQMMITNAQAYGFFKPQQEYYIDFAPCAEDQADDQ